MGDHGSAGQNSRPSPRRSASCSNPKSADHTIIQPAVLSHTSRDTGCHAKPNQNDLASSEHFAKVILPHSSQLHKQEALFDAPRWRPITNDEANFEHGDLAQKLMNMGPRAPAGGWERVQWPVPRSDADCTF